MSREPLEYESAAAGALAPGEVVLWEQHAADLEKSTARAASTQAPDYRITSRRIMRLSPQSGKSDDYVAIADVAGFEIHRRYAFGRDLSFSVRILSPGIVTFEKVTQWRRVVELLASLPPATDRRYRLRRGEPRPPIQPRFDQTELPQMTVTPHTFDELVLTDGEIVLWSGRPEPKRLFDGDWLVSRLRILAWLCIPTAILLARTGAFEDVLAGSSGVPWIFVAAAAIWLIIGVYSLTLKPFVVARRESRTRYLLTNLRAVSIYDGPALRSTCSHFLDIAQSAEMNEGPDGVGDIVLSSGVRFIRVKDVRRTYSLLLEAIGSTAPPQQNDSDPS